MKKFSLAMLGLFSLGFINVCYAQSKDAGTNRISLNASDFRKPLSPTVVISLPTAGIFYGVINTDCGDGLQGQGTSFYYNCGLRDGGKSMSILQKASELFNCSKANEYQSHKGQGFAVSSPTEAISCKLNPANSEGFQKSEKNIVNTWDVLNECSNTDCNVVFANPQTGEVFTGKL